MSFFFKVCLPCLVIIVCISQPIFADHGPQRMFGRQIQPYFSAHETKQVGPFKIDLHTYGEEFQYDLSNINNQKYHHIFDDRFNIATLLREDNEIIYTRFHKGYAIDENSLLHGMSMSKTALAAAIGSIKCKGQIKSLDDTMGYYSDILKETPYSNVSIRNALQMNSGVSPLNREKNNTANQMAMGMGEYEGKANLISAVKIFDKSLRTQGTKHNYHSADPFALSLLITEITGLPASEVFFQNIYKLFSSKGQIHWISDKNGYTVSQARLVMKSPDWSKFGQFVLDEIRKDSCIGKFFQEGKENAVVTHRENVGYGYHFWVYDINGEKMITMTGHGGFFNVLSLKKNKVLSIFSVDEKYKVGNLFGELETIISEVMN